MEGEGEGRREGERGGWRGKEGGREGGGGGGGEGLVSIPLVVQGTEKTFMTPGIFCRVKLQLGSCK